MTTLHIGTSFIMKTLIVIEESRSLHSTDSIRSSPLKPISPKPKGYDVTATSNLHVDVIRSQINNSSRMIYDIPGARIPELLQFKPWNCEMSSVANPKTGETVLVGVLAAPIGAYIISLVESRRTSFPSTFL
ncbi:hypothetical protein LOAG_04102 [Loa loa]|uniref:Uncharacterized protein n=1 Tax=Loa loa TaxID=7209 RepID=A0A1S0U2L4_LOALO|nr:hypothetical protein LOAG_04102 [Loa loa]EFO24379.1 hypothetical protein LOAG_04102 [Loa loa]